MKGLKHSFIAIFISGYRMFRMSRLARVLLLIVFIEFLVFFGLFKSFLHPRFLSPKFESEQQRLEQVFRDFTTIHKPSDK